MVRLNIWDLYEGVGEIENDEKDSCARSGRTMGYRTD